MNTTQLKFVRKSQRIRKVSYLRMWNKPTAKSLRRATVIVKNPIKNETYGMKFVIVSNELDCFLGLTLVTINTNNFTGCMEKDL